MARPPSDLDDYLDWQERLESFKASGLSIDDVSRLVHYAELGITAILFLGHYVSRGARMDWQIACLASVVHTDRKLTFLLDAEVCPSSAS